MRLGMIPLLLGGDLAALVLSLSVYHLSAIVRVWSCLLGLGVVLAFIHMIETALVCLASNIYHIRVGLMAATGFMAWHGMAGAFCLC
jgi:hypothetical protein